MSHSFFCFKLITHNIYYVYNAYFNMCCNNSFIKNNENNNVKLNSVIFLCAFIFVIILFKNFIRIKKVEIKLIKKVINLELSNFNFDKNHKLIIRGTIHNLVPYREIHEPKNVTIFSIKNNYNITDIIIIKYINTKQIICF